MYKNWIILYFSLLALPLYGQPTFSRVIDVDSDAMWNYARDFEIIDSSLYVYSLMYCDFDNPNDNSCMTIAKLDMNGNITKTIILDNLFKNSQPRSLATDGVHLYVSGHLRGTSTKTITVTSLNRDLEKLAVHHYKPSQTNEDMIALNSGISYIDSSLFIYNSIWDTAQNLPKGFQLININTDGNEFWRKSYSFTETSKEFMHDLQLTPDGNMAAILNIEQPPGIIKDFDGRVIIKMDKDGQLLDSLKLPDVKKSGRSLVVSPDGGYIFGSAGHPFGDHTIYIDEDDGHMYEAGYGLVNKIDPAMDTLEWFTILPNNQLIDNRIYRLSHFIEASNGDIIACGQVFDKLDSEGGPLKADMNLEWGGYIVRLSPEGEIKWHHVYKTPNDLLPIDEYGRYRPSLLIKLKELPDGRIVAYGNVYFNKVQGAVINPMERENMHLWVLMVDENGCIDGYNCNEIIRLDHDYIKEFNIGDQWIYEEEYAVGGSGGLQIGYNTTEIQDTFFDGTRTKYLLDTRDTFYVENDKMYFWDKHFEEYIMYYDWQANHSSYEIKYYDQFRNSEEIATVIVDSISYKYFGNDLLRAQHVRILNSGTMDEYEEIVYEGIGAGHYGIKLLLGCGHCDNNPYTTHLRCFVNDTMTYKFVPYSCDSTWLKTSVINAGSKDVVLYPNPTSGLVNIEGIYKNVEYVLYDINGQFIEKGITTDKAFTIKGNGVYLVRFKIDGEWIQRKIIKIK